MKKILLLLVLFSFAALRAQDTIATTAKAPETQNNAPKLRKEYFKMYYIFPGGVGNNVLAKANKGKFGFGFAVTLFTIDNLHFSLGYEVSQYNVTDISLAGNIKNTWINNYYIAFLYKMPLAERVDFNPKFAIGYMTLGQRSYGNSYGRQEGPGFTPGFDVDFKLTGGFRIFAGVNYTLFFPKTETSKEYKSFFGTIQQFNIVTGIKF